MCAAWGAYSPRHDSKVCSDGDQSALSVAGWNQCQARRPEPARSGLAWAREKPGGRLGWSSAASLSCCFCWKRQGTTGGRGQPQPGGRAAVSSRRRGRALRLLGRWKPPGPEERSSGSLKGTGHGSRRSGASSPARPSCSECTAWRKINRQIKNTGRLWTAKLWCQEFESSRINLEIVFTVRAMRQSLAARLQKDAHEEAMEEVNWKYGVTLEGNHAPTTIPENWKVI